MVKAYAVNCNDAWLIPDDEPKEGHYVKYEDYAALKELTDKLVKLRQGGCMSFGEQKALDDLLRDYKRD